jgi:hypothetical protein
MNKLNHLFTAAHTWIATRNASLRDQATANPDQGSGVADTVIITGVFVAIAVLVGSYFYDAIVAAAKHTADQISGQ